MRRFDKAKNILKANLLAESRYLESKGLIKENELTENVDYTQEELDEYLEASKEIFKIMRNEPMEGDIAKKLIELKNNGIKFIPKFIKEKRFPKNEWWENRFHQTTTFDFIDEGSGEVYTFIANDEDWWEGMPTLFPYSKLELSLLYENNLIDNAPKNAMDVIKFKNASPDLSNANLHSINERLH